MPENGRLTFAKIDELNFAEIVENLRGIFGWFYEVFW